MSTGGSQAGARKFRSLEYGLGLLGQFTVEQPERGISELARALRVSPPTAHRYAATCLELGYLEQISGRRYRLARRSAEPGRALVAAMPIVRRAEPILRELREQTGRTIGLAVLDGADVLYLQRLCGYARGQYRSERGLGAGSHRPASSTAAGRALLGEQDELVVEEGGLNERALGMAIAVRVDSEQTGALEITVPAQAMSAAELLIELGEVLRAGAERLRERILEP